jgi:hypothetical protein
MVPPGSRCGTAEIGVAGAIGEGEESHASGVVGAQRVGCSVGKVDGVRVILLVVCRRIKALVNRIAMNLKTLELLPSYRLCRFQHALGLETIEAHEHVNHAAVCKNDFIVDRIELRIKCHLCSARAQQICGLLQKFWGAT